MGAKTPRGVVYVPPMPNEKSRHQTPASLAIDLHYANLLLVERWDWDRYSRLCNLLKLTPHEMASLVLLPHKYVERFRELNGLPMNYAHARAVGLILTLLEAHLCKHISKDVIENPFPKLT